MSITRIQVHAEKLAAIARHSAARASASPEDPWASLIARNQQLAAEDAHHQFVTERIALAGQMIDFRFFGARADGSIPLDSFIKIFDPISRALKSAAQRLLTGSDEGRINRIVADHLNLKLSGLSYGSTRVFISGSVAPDLTNTSLLEKTLEASFQLLNASNVDFYDSVDRVGGRSAAIFLEALSAIDNAGFGTEFSWVSPRGRELWRGTPNELSRLKTLLDGVHEPDVYEEELSGYVSKLFESGKIEIRTEEDKIPVTYPLNLIEHVQRLSISSPARLRVMTSQYYDGIRKKDIFKRNLIEVL